MNYVELIQSVANETDMSKASIKRVFEAQRGVIENVLKKPKEGIDGVALPGIGKFQVVKRSARNGVNPYTGDKLKIKAKRIPVCKMSSTLKKIVSKKK